MLPINYDEDTFLINWVRDKYLFALLWIWEYLICKKDQPAIVETD